MSDVIIVAIIVSIPGIISSVSSILNGKKLDVVHKATNSMKDELVAAALLQGASNEKEKQAQQKENK